MYIEEVYWWINRNNIQLNHEITIILLNQKKICRNKNISTDYFNIVVIFKYFLLMSPNIYLLFLSLNRETYWSFVWKVFVYNYRNWIPNYPIMLHVKSTAPARKQLFIWFIGVKNPSAAKYLRMITNLFVVTIEFHYHTNKNIEFGVISLSSHSLCCYESWTYQIHFW